MLKSLWKLQKNPFWLAMATRLATVFDVVAITSYTEVRPRNDYRANN